jgi:hypothetical protein
MVSPGFVFSTSLSAFEQSARPFVKRMKAARALSSFSRSRSLGRLEAPRQPKTGPDEFLKFR